jgi:hypothetical protein
MSFIILERFIFKENFTIGRIFINDIFFCYTLELPWVDNQKRKSCIPEGEYICQAYSSEKHPNVVELQNVPDRSKILIHAGNYPKDTLGCILVGNAYDEEKGVVWSSKATLHSLFTQVGYNFKINVISNKKMALSVLALATPFAKIIGKKLTKKTAEIVLKKVKEKTGIDIATKEQARTALEKMKPEDIKEVELAVINADKQKFLTEIKHGEKLEQTFKDDFITYAIYIFLFCIVGVLFYDGVRGVMIIENIKLLFEGYFGLTFMLVSISAVGLRHIALKAVEGFINKYR